MPITIAEILHRTADEYLSRYARSWLGDDNLSSYSCGAIGDCITDLVTDGVITAEEETLLDHRIFVGLEAMGVDSNSTEQYAEFPYTMMQDARYGWLKFAAMIAEEQGV